MKLENPEIKIVTYPDMSKLEELRLKSLAELEREVWGYYGEYAICSDINCRAVQSISEVYDGVDDEENFIRLAELEKNGALLPDCPVCKQSSELFFPPNIMTKFLKHQFSSEIFGALLIDQNKDVQGCTIASRGKLVNIFNSFNYRLSYPQKEWLASIADCLGEEYKDGLKDVVSWNRLEIAHDLRGRGYFFPLLKALLDLHREYDNLPVIGDTRFESRVYPFLKAVGYQDIIADKHGWLTVALKRYKRLREAVSLTRSDLKNAFQKKLQKKRELQKKHLAKLKLPKQQKCYKGIPSLTSLFV